MNWRYYLIAAVYALGLFLGYLIGTRHGSDEVRREAVLRGHARYYCAETGGAGWEWCRPCIAHWELLEAKQRMEACGQ